MRKATILKASIAAVLLIIVIVIATDNWVTGSTKQQLYTSIEKIPHNKIGLLLGTSKNLNNGQINLYYQYRIDAAVALYKAGKIDFILVSGDNGREGYDETSA